MPESLLQILLRILPLNIVDVDTYQSIVYH